jgi:hypothetical protein
VVDELNTGDIVTVTFPMVEATEEYTLKWKQSEFWKESTNPGPSWRPDETPVRYTCRIRRNTLVDIAPRQEGRGYPLYQRDHLKQSRASTRNVTRYIPPIILQW